MPNGNGGVPFLGAPIIFAALFAVLAGLSHKSRFFWAWAAICLVIAGRFAGFGFWRSLS